MYHVKKLHQIHAFSQHEKVLNFSWLVMLIMLASGSEVCWLSCCCVVQKILCMPCHFSDESDTFLLHYLHLYIPTCSISHYYYSILLFTLDFFLSLSFMEERSTDADAINIHIIFTELIATYKYRGININTRTHHILCIHHHHRFLCAVVLITDHLFFLFFFQ